MKYLLVMTDSNNVINFRKKLIELLKHEGHSVVVVAHDEKRKDDIEALGVSFYCAEQNNRGLNPLSMLSYEKKLKSIMKKENPDVVFTFQLKPNTFGVMAAKKAGVKKIYSMVEGAGDVFVHDSLKWKIIRFVVCSLYRRAFRWCAKVFFLNNDDKSEFIERKLVTEDKCETVYGIGCDLEHFSYSPLKENGSFLMIARMLRAKGTIEYCKCARIVKQKHPQVAFNYLGAEGDIKVSDIQEYIDDGSINYLGTTKDVRPYIENCSLLLLPSHREGMPMSIMEAESMGRPIITSNSVGCKDTVVNGYNGFLIEKYDYEKMAELCIFALENFKEIQQMGVNARRFAEENFDSDKINGKIYGIINV